jgi:hypothetical protein
VASVTRVKTYNEGQSFTATFKFFDSAYVASSPLTLRYRIDDLTNRIMIRDWTVVSPSQTVDIEVTPDDNEIQNSGNARERKQMVVQTNYETDTQSVQSIDWFIENLQGVT